MSVVLGASKNESIEVLKASKNESIEIHQYDVNPLIRSYISCE